MENGIAGSFPHHVNHRKERITLSRISGWMPVVSTTFGLSANKNIGQRNSAALRMIHSWKSVRYFTGAAVSRKQLETIVCAAMAVRDGNSPVTVELAGCQPALRENAGQRRRLKWCAPFWKEPRESGWNLH
jgi:hypothetical protein